MWSVSDIFFCLRSFNFFLKRNPDIRVFFQVRIIFRNAKTKKKNEKLITNKPYLSKICSDVTDIEIFQS